MKIRVVDTKNKYYLGTRRVDLHKSDVLRLKRIKKRYRYISLADTITVLIDHWYDKK